MKTFHSLLRFPRLVAASALLSAFLGLAGCDLLGGGSTEAPGESGLTSEWIGKPLDSLIDVSSIAFRDGRLFVANRHATAPGVAVVDTATGLITEYYPEIVPPSSMAFTSSGHLIVTETSFDYMEGSVSAINLGAKKIRKSVITFGSDNGVASADDGKVYLFDRTTGAVTGFTGNTPGSNVTFDVQAGAFSNPYGIAVMANKAYIPRYNSASLLILGSADQLGGGARDSIDLSAYVSRTPVDSAASVPRMAHVAIHGGTLFVTLQRLNYRYKAFDTSYVLAINATTKAVESVIPLAFRNPVSAVVHNGFWFISGEQGSQGDGNLLGGVEKINLATGQHAGTVTTEAALGGDVSNFAATGASTGYAVFSPGWPTYKVKKIAP
jgi:hypothetical protein